MGKAKIDFLLHHFKELQVHLASFILLPVDFRGNLDLNWDYTILRQNVGDVQR